MKIFNIVKTDKKDWLILGGKLATRIVKDADKGISQDGDGDKFPPYSTRNAGVGWRRIKTKKGVRTVFIDSYFNLKKSGKVGKKGVSKDRQVSPPNLRLTGKMLDSIKAQKATKTSVEILFADGNKVMGHAKKRGNKPRRNIYGLNNSNQQLVEDYLSKKIENNILRFVAKDIEIDLNI